MVNKTDMQRWTNKLIDRSTNKPPDIKSIEQEDKQTSIEDV
jgi:hypothetical protein